MESSGASGLAHCDLCRCRSWSWSDGTGQSFLWPGCPTGLDTPSYLFGPVWTLLYAMMGIAAWLIWRSGGFRSNRTALMLYLVQLVLNALWSWIFFAWQSGFWAFADILVLWVLIIATLVSFWRVRPLAGGLLCPYLLWVTFASALNYSVWQLNPQILG